MLIQYWIIPNSAGSKLISIKYKVQSVDQAEIEKEIVMSATEFASVLRDIGEQHSLFELLSKTPDFAVSILNSISKGEKPIAGAAFTEISQEDVVLLTGAHLIIKNSIEAMQKAESFSPSKTPATEEASSTHCAASEDYDLLPSQEQQAQALNVKRFLAYVNMVQHFGATQHASSGNVTPPDSSSPFSELKQGGMFGTPPRKTSSQGRGAPNTPVINRLRGENSGTAPNTPVMHRPKIEPIDFNLPKDNPALPLLPSHSGTESQDNKACCCCNPNCTLL